jgi:predicted TIM-barrel fold metal-dependent hydrolase
MRAFLAFAPFLAGCSATLPPVDDPSQAVPAAVMKVESSGTPAPRIAYHQHLFSPATAALIKQPIYVGTQLIADLDRARIDRGVVLSMGYTYGDERKAVADADARVREENDWTDAEVARAGGRLIGFCSANPLREAALAEVKRCTQLPNTTGLKLHFANSGVDLRDPAHAAKVADVFAAANAAGAPIVVHMRLRTTSKATYGAEDARLFIDKLLGSAPDIVVQIAHLAGAGSFPEDAEKAMAAFAEAIARGDPRTRNLLFDATTVAMSGSTKGDGEFIAKAIRSVGVDRILFGSDAPVGGNPPVSEAWDIFRAKVPLSEAEFRTIALNVAPYARP